MARDVREIHGQSLQEVESFERARFLVLNRKKGVSQHLRDGLAIVFLLVVLVHEWPHAVVDGLADVALEFEPRMEFFVEEDSREQTIKDVHEDVDGFVGRT